VMSCWARRHLTSSFILLHGPPGCGKTACIKHILSQSCIPHEYFDCSALYEGDGSSFSTAVNSVALQIKRRLLHSSSSDVGAMLVLDRLECMFPHLSPHAQVMC
jgi:Cdc6-like AAA superfamily ATPase